MNKCKPMLEKVSADERMAHHPCYSEKAHHYFARIHLAVSPACNIQCNYCNRKYDCANESRPGVASELLKPEEALRKLCHVAGSVKELSVVGIAGPGDALANPRRTFKTLNLVRKKFPDLALCLSTNGLALPDYAGEITSAGVRHVTVTVNTFNPQTAAKIYKWITVDGKKRSGAKAMEYLLRRQQKGINMLCALGVLVKVNSLLIPGINDDELPVISKKLKLMGVFVHNIMPLISSKKHGTAFGLSGHPEPTGQELESIRERCGDMKQMAHCRQCRADAVGKLSDDRFAGFRKDSFNEILIPSGNGYENRKRWRSQVAEFLAKRGCEDVRSAEGEYLIAVCTKGMGIVNQHFGHAKEFLIYKIKSGGAKLINVRKVKKNFCEGPATCGDEGSELADILDTISDCNAVVCLKVGYGVHKLLEQNGIRPIVDLPYIPVEAAALLASARLSGRSAVPVSQKTFRKVGRVK